MALVEAIRIINAKEGGMKELEGKIIDVDNFGSIEQGRVIGCDFDIGITIVSNSKSDRYLACLIGPSSPLWENHLSEKAHKALFGLIVKQIQDGVLYIKAVCALDSSLYDTTLNNWGASAETCPFGQ